MPATITGLNTAIDHRAEAVRLAHEAENVLTHVYGRAADAHVYATLAQVHAQLSATQPPGDDPYWTQAKELETLRERYAALQNAESAAQVRLADLESSVREMINAHDGGRSGDAKRLIDRLRKQA